MKVLPFQQLFIRQELAHGSSLSNQLSGTASIRNADWELIQNCIEQVLELREWPFLRLNENRTEWQIGNQLNGTLILNDSTTKPLSLEHLWTIHLFKEGETVVLKFCLHHALGDAHSFQLFWSDVKTLYQKGRLIPAALNVNFDSGSTSLNLGNIKTIPQLGLGPIERITLNLSTQRIQKLYHKCLEQGIYVSTFMLGALQDCLTELELNLGITTQTGIALRNRSGKIARSAFLTQVNFLPVEHAGLTELKNLESTIKNCFRNQSHPLLQWLTEDSRSTAFNVLFSYQKEAYQEVGDDLEADFTFLPTAIDENLVSLHVLEFGEHSMSISFDVRTDIADLTFWRSWIYQYLMVLNRARNHEIPVLKLPKAEILAGPKGLPFWSDFLNASEDTVAIICGNDSITFGSLKQRLTKASVLQKELLHLTPNRSIETIVEILQQWWLGGSVTFMQDRNLKISKDPILYVSETTGTTGEPKTIQISRTGIESMLLDWKDRLHIVSNSVHLSIADMRFDVFFGDLFRSLFLGTRLVLATEEERLSPTSIQTLIYQHSVTHLESTPSFLQLILQQNGTLNGLKHLICGSEAMTSSFFNAVQKLTTTKVYNSYGLTEVSIDSALCELKKVNGQYPVGWPIGDQSFRICDASGKLLAAGMWGELHIEGSCVGIPLVLTERYYYREGNVLVYKTGDRAMIHRHYGLIVSGRLTHDFIKIHGKRIPVSRIEQLVSSLGTFSHCCVIPHNGSAVLLHNLPHSKEEIQSFLLGHLTPIQLPDIIQFHEDWPLNQNGKIDRKNLETTIKLTIDSREKWEPNASEKEQRIYAILTSFEKSYGKADESLLHFGWNSIDLLSLSNELMLNGIHVPATSIIANPCINTLLAEEVNSADVEKSDKDLNIDDIDMDDILGILNRS